MSQAVKDKYNQVRDRLKEKEDRIHAHIERFVKYCKDSELAKNSQGYTKNPHFQKLSAEQLVKIYEQVEAEGLHLDGKNITIQSTGISYNYQAYKNKMLLVYPETIIDIQLVMAGDTYDFRKESGKVIYSHQIEDPFAEESGNMTANFWKDLKGGYIVIKNRRGEFLTTMKKPEIQKHKQIARTSDIWDQFPKEMSLKTVIKKGVSMHFRDEFETMEEADNQNYNLEKLQGAQAAGIFTDEHYDQMSTCKSMDELELFMESHPELVNSLEFQNHFKDISARLTS